MSSFPVRGLEFALNVHAQGHGYAFLCQRRWIWPRPRPFIETAGGDGHVDRGMNNQIPYS